MTILRRDADEVYREYLAYAETKRREPPRNFLHVS
jgi:hypothetical protein